MSQNLQTISYTWLLKVQPVLVDIFWKCSQYLWKSFESGTNTCGNNLKVEPILVEIFWKRNQYLRKSWHPDTTGGRLSWAWWNCGTLQPGRVRWAELRACCSLFQYIFWEIGALWVTSTRPLASSRTTTWRWHCIVGIVVVVVVLPSLCGWRGSLSRLRRWFA